MNAKLRTTNAEFRIHHSPFRIGRGPSLTVGVLIALCVLCGCNSGKVLSENKAPVVEAETRVDAQAIVGLLNKVTQLENTIGELKTQIATSTAGRDIYNIKTGGLTAAAVLFLYVIAERWRPTRAIKEALKGRRDAKEV